MPNAECQVPNEMRLTDYARIFGTWHSAFGIPSTIGIIAVVRIVRCLKE
jgi:hypothetical protein